MISAHMMRLVAIRHTIGRTVEEKIVIQAAKGHFVCWFAKDEITDAIKADLIAQGFFVEQNRSQFETEDAHFWRVSW